MFCNHKSAGFLRSSDFHERDLFIDPFLLEPGFVVVGLYVSSNALPFHDKGSSASVTVWSKCDSLNSNVFEQ